MKRTNEEMRKRIALVAEMLCQGLRRTQIHQECEQRWGANWRSADTYMSRARNELCQEIAQPREILIGRSHGFYQSMVRKSGASDRNRLFACERIDKLLGLEAPQRQELSGPGGRPVEVARGPDVSQLTNEELDQLTRLLETAKERLVAKTAAQAGPAMAAQLGPVQGNGNGHVEEPSDPDAALEKRELEVLREPAEPDGNDPTTSQ